MESQIKVKEGINAAWNRYRELFPDLAEAYDALPAAVYTGGRLDGKTKRIMAVAIAVACGCRACMLFQTERALEFGADAEEILEACGVAVSLGGTMAAGEVTRVVRYLEETGHIGG